VTFGCVVICSRINDKVGHGVGDAFTSKLKGLGLGIRGVHLIHILVV